MYCEKCGALIPTGLNECPNCLHAKEKWIGEIFEFHFESGLSSTSKREIDHTVSLQKYEMVITAQKSLTVMKRKSKPAITQAVRYQDILSIQEKTGLALDELPLIVFFALLVVFCALPYNIIALLACILAIKWAARTMITIELKNNEVIKIPYSGKRGVSNEFIEAANAMRK